MEEGGFEARDGVVIDPETHRGGVQVPAAVYNFEFNDDVCALCGDGGLLICCEGPCLRSFHATIEADEHHGCPTLGFTTAQVEAIQHFFCVDCTNGQAFSHDVCALCGDGGLIISCEGPCLRSFHATVEDDQHHGCPTLGFTTAQVEVMPHFFCTNCTNRQHQCARCGELGSSDVANAQVFRCSHVTCGLFYHPACIGAQLHPGDPVRAARCQEQVAAGVAFQCLGLHHLPHDYLF